MISVPPVIKDMVFVMDIRWAMVIIMGITIIITMGDMGTMIRLKDIILKMYDTT